MAFDYKRENVVERIQPTRDNIPKVRIVGDVWEYLERKSQQNRCAKKIMNDRCLQASKL